MVKIVKATDLGGAAFDSSGQIEDRSKPPVWVVIAVPPEGGGIYISLHETEIGARQRLQEKAVEWDVSPDNVSGGVRLCEIEMP